MINSTVFVKVKEPWASSIQCMGWGLHYEFREIGYAKKGGGGI